MAEEEQYTDGSEEEQSSGLRATKADILADTFGDDVSDADDVYDEAQHQADLRRALEQLGMDDIDIAEDATSYVDDVPQGEGVAIGGDNMPPSMEDIGDYDFDELDDADLDIVFDDDSEMDVSDQDEMVDVESVGDEPYYYEEDDGEEDEDSLGFSVDDESFMEEDEETSMDDDDDVDEESEFGFVEENILDDHANEDDEDEDEDEIYDIGSESEMVDNESAADEIDEMPMVASPIASPFKRETVSSKEEDGELSSNQDGPAIASPVASMSDAFSIDSYKVHYNQPYAYEDEEEDDDDSSSHYEHDDMDEEDSYAHEHEFDDVDEEDEDEEEYQAVSEDEDDYVFDDVLESLEDDLDSLEVSNDDEDDSAGYGDMSVQQEEEPLPEYSPDLLDDEDSPFVHMDDDESLEDILEAPDLGGDGGALFASSDNAQFAESHDDMHNEQDASMIEENMSYMPQEEELDSSSFEDQSQEDLLAALNDALASAPDELAPEETPYVPPEEEDDDDEINYITQTDEIFIEEDLLEEPEVVFTYEDLLEYLNGDKKAANYAMSYAEQAVAAGVSVPVHVAVRRALAASPEVGASVQKSRDQGRY